MGIDNQSSSLLKAQLSKMAKLSNMQAGLPSVLRGAPVIAMAAGHVLAKATNGRNVVEERLLGAEDTILLDAASHGPQTGRASVRRRSKETV